MNAETIAHSDEHDRLFLKYGGTLVYRKGADPSCGFRTFIEYCKKINEPFPVTLERQKEIEELIAQERGR